MSDQMRGKYEVLKLIRSNVLLALEAYGLPVSNGTVKGWECMEANQPGIKNADMVVTLEQKQSSRIGWQYRGKYKYDSETRKFDRDENWMEEQEWVLTAILKRTTKPVTANTVTTNDVIMMLVTWFNGGPGLEYFRENRCGNLLIGRKDITLYKDDSDVSQYSSSCLLKLHVPKKFVFKTPSAGVVFEGAYQC